MVGQERQGTSEQTGVGKTKDDGAAPCSVNHPGHHAGAHATRVNLNGAHATCDHQGARHATRDPRTGGAQGVDGRSPLHSLITLIFQCPSTTFNNAHFLTEHRRSSRMVPKTSSMGGPKALHGLPKRANFGVGSNTSCSQGMPHSSDACPANSKIRHSVRSWELLCAPLGGSKQQMGYWAIGSLGERTVRLETFPTQLGRLSRLLTEYTGTSITSTESSLRAQ